MNWKMDNKRTPIIAFVFLFAVTVVSLRVISAENQAENFDFGSKSSDQTVNSEVQSLKVQELDENSQSDSFYEVPAGRAIEFGNDAGDALLT